MDHDIARLIYCPVRAFMFCGIILCPALMILFGILTVAHPVSFPYLVFLILEILVSIFQFFWITSVLKIRCSFRACLRIIRTSSSKVLFFDGGQCLKLKDYYQENEGFKDEVGSHCLILVDDVTRLLRNSYYYYTLWCVWFNYVTVRDPEMVERLARKYLQRELRIFTQGLPEDFNKNILKIEIPKSLSESLKLIVVCPNKDEAVILKLMMC